MLTETQMRRSFFDEVFFAPINLRLKHIKFTKNRMISPFQLCFLQFVQVTEIALRTIYMLFSEIREHGDGAFLTKLYIV
jgi:hypothetical protein